MNPTIVVVLLCAIVAIHVRYVDSGDWRNIIIFKKIFRSATKSVKKTRVPKAIKTEPPTISLNTILSYQDKFRLYAEIMQHKILEPTISVTSIRDFDEILDKPRKTADPIAEIYKDTMLAGVNLMNEYDKLIDLKNEYFKSALYYRALHWIQFQMGYYKPIVDAAQKIIQSKKAKNYLAEIFMLDKEPKWIDSSDSTLNKLEGWSLTNKYDDAAYFMKTIVPPVDKNDADEYLFERTFGRIPGLMIQIVDYAFDVKVKAGQINVKSPRSEAPPLDQITLSATTNLMERRKYASILYVRAIQKKLKLNFLIAGLWSDIREQSTRSSPLRLDSFQLYMSNLPIGMTEMLNFVKPLRLFSQRSYLQRISQWYQYQVHYDNNPSKEFDEEMNKLLNTSHAKHIITDIPSLVNELFKITADFNKMNTFENILKMGEEMDSALSFVMKDTFDQLQEERKKYEDLIAQLEPFKNKTSSLKKQLEEFYKERAEIRKAIRNVLSFGMPTKKIVKPPTQMYCRIAVAKAIDGALFRYKFRTNINDLCQKLPSSESRAGGTVSPDAR